MVLFQAMQSASLWVTAHRVADVTMLLRQMVRASDMETSRPALHDSLETHCPWEIARGLLCKMLDPDPETRPSAASLLGEIGRIVTMRAAADAPRAAMVAASDAELSAGKAELAYRQCKDASTQARRSRRA